MITNNQSPMAAAHRSGAHALRLASQPIVNAPASAPVPHRQVQLASPSIYPVSPDATVLQHQVQQAAVQHSDAGDREVLRVLYKQRMYLYSTQRIPRHLSMLQSPPYASTCQ